MRVSALVCVWQVHACTNAFVCVHACSVACMGVCSGACPVRACKCVCVQQQRQDNNEKPSRVKLQLYVL